METFRKGPRNQTAGSRCYEKASEQKLPTLAGELAHDKVDSILAISAAAVIAAKQVTTTIPIVMIINSDPVETGLVASYARPGGNVTGFSPMTPELPGKRLGLLKEVVPGIERVAVFWEPIPAKTPDFRETRVAPKRWDCNCSRLRYEIAATF